MKKQLNNTLSETQKSFLDKNGYLILRNIKVIKKNFSAEKINDEETVSIIKKINLEEKFVLDPHTATAFAAVKKISNLSEVIILGTAHPIKFSDTVEKAIGHPMQSTNEFFEMYKNEEKFYSFMNSAEEVRKVIKDNYSK